MEIYKCIRLLMGEPEGKRSRGRPRSRWEDYIKMDFMVVMLETGWT